MQRFHRSPSFLGGRPSGPASTSHLHGERGRGRAGFPGPPSSPCGAVTARLPKP
ncbi:hypothetical protein HMPREF0262_02684 [Clostridium sp. ATCC 29733]|nr:hypothetical protein HMPREF0262_02684 [Clostridium sp. ATCC 29733]